jgi:hypothetical protein
LEMVFGSDALLKIKGWVPMSPNALLMWPLKTTNLHGCMIKKQKPRMHPTNWIQLSWARKWRFKWQWWQMDLL